MCHPSISIRYLLVRIESLPVFEVRENALDSVQSLSRSIPEALEKQRRLGAYDKMK